MSTEELEHYAISRITLFVHCLQLMRHVTFVNDLTPSLSVSRIGGKIMLRQLAALAVGLRGSVFAPAAPEFLLAYIFTNLSKNFFSPDVIF